MFGQIPFLIGEAWRGFRLHRTVILPSLVTIFLCVLLLAASLSFFLGSRHILEDRDSVYGVEAYLLDVPDSLQRIALEKRLWKIKVIRAVQYVSPAEAMQEFTTSFSTEMLELVEGNPLPASYRLQMAPAYQNPGELQKLLGELSRWQIFDRVQAPGKWAQWIEGWRFDLTFWPIFISVILVITLALIIGNSVRLTLYSRKLLVENMKYAGGSNAFIQFPFVIEGAMQGLLGSIAAVVLWTVFTYWLVGLVPVLVVFTEGLRFWMVSLVVLVTLLGAYSSHRVVRSFLHRSW